MWRTNFLRIFQESKLTPKQLAEKSLVSENTIKRIIKHPEATIQLETLNSLAKGLGYTIEDIINDSVAFVGGANYEALQEKVEKLAKTITNLESENTILLADKKLLENEIIKLNKDLLSTKLEYTEKLLSVYEKFSRQEKD